MSAGPTILFLEKTPLAHAIEAASGEGFMELASGPILHAALVSGILVALAAAVKRSYRESRVLPEEKTFSLANLLELGVSGLLSFTQSIMGAHARRFLPLIGTCAFFILFSNLLGIVPGFEPPTSNLNTTVACALVVVVATHWVGVRTHGAAYIKHFLGPVWWLAWLMFPIEVIGHLARVLSLSMRLFGNMFGDHMVVAVFMGLVPLLVPVIFMGVGVFVSVVQAFVFTLLSIIYISGALEEAH